MGAILSQAQRLTLRTSVVLTPEARFIHGDFTVHSIEVRTEFTDRRVEHGQSAYVTENRYILTGQHLSQREVVPDLVDVDVPQGVRDHFVRWHVEALAAVENVQMRAEMADEEAVS